MTVPQSDDAAGGAEAGAKSGTSVGTQIRYMADLMLFRSLIDQTQLDSAATAPGKPKQFLYLADANVLQFCFDPRGEASLARVFRFSPPKAARDAGVAIITADFLLRGQLPGRNRLPLYVTPQHWDEFVRQFKKLYEGIQQARAQMKPDEGATLRREIDALRGDIAAAQNNARKLTDLYNSRVQALFVDASLDVFARPKMLANLLRSGDVVRHIGEAPFVRTKDLGPPPEERRKAWMTRLQDAMSARKKERPQATLEADAASLALIETINAGFEDRGVAAEAVLITSDDTLLAAAAVPGASSRHGVDGCVRDIRQFMPLINDRDLSQSGVEHRATDEVRLAIDSMLNVSTAASVDEDPEGFRKEAAERAEFAQMLRRRQQTLKALKEMERTNAGTPLASRARAYRKYLEVATQKEKGMPVAEELDILVAEVNSKWDALLENARRRHGARIAMYYRDWLHEILEVIEEAHEDAFGRVRRESASKHANLTRELIGCHLEAKLLPSLFVEQSSAKGFSARRWGLPLDGDASLAKQARDLVDAVRGGDRRKANDSLRALCRREKSAPARIALACAAVSLQLGEAENAGSLAATAQELTGLLGDRRAPRFLRLDLQVRVAWAMADRAAAMGGAPEDCTVAQVERLAEQGMDLTTRLAEFDKAANAPGSTGGDTGADACAAVTRALAKSEAAASLAASCVLSVVSPEAQGGVPPATLESRLVKIVELASEAIDLSQRSDGFGGKKDFMGRPLSPIVETRAAVAAVQVCAVADRRGERMPGLARSYLGDAARVIETHAADADGFGPICTAYVAAAQLVSGAAERRYRGDKARADLRGWLEGDLPDAPRAFRCERELLSRFFPVQDAGS